MGFNHYLVMHGLVPRIQAKKTTRMAGTSPRMTIERYQVFPISSALASNNGSIASRGLGGNISTARSTPASR
jgi:hypothetical protein